MTTKRWEKTQPGLIKIRASVHFFRYVNAMRPGRENQTCVRSVSGVSGFKETALLLKSNLLQSVIDGNQTTKEKEKSLTALITD